MASELVKWFVSAVAAELPKAGAAPEAAAKPAVPPEAAPAAPPEAPPEAPPRSWEQIKRGAESTAEKRRQKQL